MIRTKKKNAVLTPASQPRGQSLTEPPAASGTGAVSCRRARGQSVPSALIFLEVSVISKKALIKELQLTCNIGQHDLQTKLNHATRFLTAGNKVKVIVKFRGREMAHTERGRDLLDRFAAGVEELGTVEKVPLLDGRNMIMVLAPKKNTTTPKGKEKNGKNQDA